MGVNNTEFETFEQQFMELVAEFQSISSSESRLREAVRSESTRAEAAEAAREAAERAAAEARNGAAAATASAAGAAAALARTHEHLASVKMQVDVTERQRNLLEERCAEMSQQVSGLERELQQLRPLQAAHSTLQRQFCELQERVRAATDDARSESSRLERELRRVERCAGGGAELRERARLAAAAHARERRLAAAELQHTSKELLKAYAEISRLTTMVAELQSRLSECTHREPVLVAVDVGGEALAVSKAGLEAERAGAARLERALAAALADNKALAAALADNKALAAALADNKALAAALADNKALAAALADNKALAAALRPRDDAPERPPTPPTTHAHIKISPIDSFLAD